MKIAVVHKHDLGPNFEMPKYLTEEGIKTTYTRVLNGSYSLENHKAYTEHNGYVFVNDTEEYVSQNLPPDWSMYQAVLRVLKSDLDVDWIFVTVSDIIFADLNIRLESFVENAGDKPFASGVFEANLPFWVKELDSEKWEQENYPFKIKRTIISGWTHFIRKCDVSRIVLEEMDKDTRLMNVPVLFDNGFSGDMYFSLYYHLYPNLWHTFPHKDIIRLPEYDPDNVLPKFQNLWHLEQYEKSKSLMVFPSCFMSVKSNLSIIEDYTRKMLDSSK